MSDIKIELEPEVTVPQTEKKQKTYTYSRNGKPHVINRNYEIQNVNSLRNSSKREELIKFVETKKDELLKLKQCHRAIKLVELVKTEMNLDISYTGAKSLLKKVGLFVSVPRLKKETPEIVPVPLKEE